ncbi:hypothetical protein Q5P01_020118 [Channa striata]|uniref:Uncharacterized protein n=1 Tax=Channa striata TaxID=64152 RepID=A0AA88LX10_CHASR|nr:hypothetical protein Q5P01_020118 [Channa striata]
MADGEEIKREHLEGDREEGTDLEKLHSAASDVGRTVSTSQDFRTRLFTATSTAQIQASGELCYPSPKTNCPRETLILWIQCQHQGDV